jgi:hypothetical protein
MLPVFHVCAGDAAGALPQGAGPLACQHPWRKLQLLSQGGAKPFEVDIRHELIKRVRQRVEAGKFSEVPAPHGV